MSNSIVSCLVRSDKKNPEKPLYHVVCVNGRWTCTCKAFEFCRTAPKTCKHVRAVVEAGVEPVVVPSSTETPPTDPFARVKR